MPKVKVRPKERDHFISTMERSDTITLVTLVTLLTLVTFKGAVKLRFRHAGFDELYLKVVFKGKGGVSTGRLLAAVNRPH